MSDDTTVLVDVEEQPPRKSASTVLVELAIERYDFGVSTLGETFALPKTGPKVVAMLRNSKTSLRNQLARAYFQTHRRAAPQQALADALLVIEGLAQEQAERELYLRVARYGGNLWLDLGDATGRAIRITGAGWTVKHDVPLLFKRTALNGPLPEPSRDGSLEILWRWLNVDEEDRAILVAWMVAALFHDIPHPILSFFGEQGTGKTTAQKLVVSVIDPGPVPTRKPPRDADSWVTAAAGSWVVGLDNMSDVPAWLSDSMCRAVSGDGDVRRRLYTDGDHAVFSFRRCLCLNSIDLGAVRGDLAERMLPISLGTIHEDKRLMEEELWPLWAEEHPKILGGLLDLAAGVMAAIPFVALVSKPRMADFARILAAVDKVLGSSGLAHYISKQGAMATDSLDGDPFVTAIFNHGEFVGTAAELLDKITPERPPKGWPANPRAVTQRLRRQAPVMRKAGWEVFDDGATNHRKVTLWTIRRPEITRICSPPSPQTRKSGAAAGQEGDAGQEYGPSPYVEGNGAAEAGPRMVKL